MNAARQALPEWSMYVQHDGDPAAVALPLSPEPDYRVYDFAIAGQGTLQNLKIQFPAERAALRIRGAEILQQATDAFPLWRCNALTDFQGLLWPRRPDQLYLGGDLLFLTSAGNRTLTLSPYPPLARPCVLRLILAVERSLSEEFRASLEAHCRRAQAERRDTEQRCSQEGQELAATISRLECELRVVTTSKLWLLTAFLRDLRIRAKKVVKFTLKTVYRTLVSRR